MASLSLEHINAVTAKQDSLWGTVSVALSEAVNRQATLASPLVTLLPLSELENALTGKRVYGTATLQTTTAHTVIITLETSSAAALADIAVGGDGSNPPAEIEEGTLQVLQQVLFVLGNGLAQSLANLTNSECNLLQVEGRHDVIEPPIEWLTQDNLLRMDAVLQVSGLDDGWQEKRKSQLRRHPRRQPGQVPAPSSCWRKLGRWRNSPLCRWRKPRRSLCLLASS